MSPAFLALALLILGTASAAMLSRNLVHSALLLVLNWVGVAGFYLWAGADFAGFSQIMVYVGGVSMIVLFAVLLTRRQRNEEEVLASHAGTGRILWGLSATFWVGSALVSAIVAAPLRIQAGAAPVMTVKRLGEGLAGPHLAAVLVVAVLLTVALIGALLIAAPASAEDQPEPAAVFPQRAERRPEEAP